jgi:hypothetical protein
MMKVSQTSLPGSVPDRYNSSLARERKSAQKAHATEQNRYHRNRNKKKTRQKNRSKWMKGRQQDDSERRYSPLEEKEEPDKEDDDDSKNPHTYSNNPPVAAVTPGPARLHMISRENEDPQINYNYKDTRDRRGWKHHGNSHPTSRKSRELKGPKQQSHPSSQSVTQAKAEVAGATDLNKVEECDLSVDGPALVAHWLVMDVGKTSLLRGSVDHRKTSGWRAKEFGDCGDCRDAVAALDILRGAVKVSIAMLVTVCLTVMLVFYVANCLWSRLAP